MLSKIRNIKMLLKRKSVMETIIFFLPEKCLVYVSLCDVPGAEDWRSEIFSPSREDILYKKVIRFKVPPIAPNYDISSPVYALLHLECPQSNQYCNTEFKYTPLDTGKIHRNGFFYLQKNNKEETEWALTIDGIIVTCLLCGKIIVIAI